MSGDLDPWAALDDEKESVGEEDYRGLGRYVRFKTLNMLCEEILRHGAQKAQIMSPSLLTNQELIELDNGEVEVPVEEEDDIAPTKDAPKFRHSSSCDARLERWQAGADVAPWAALDEEEESVGEENEALAWLSGHLLFRFVRLDQYWTRLFAGMGTAGFRERW